MKVGDEIGIGNIVTINIIITIIGDVERQERLPDDKIGDRGQGGQKKRQNQTPDDRHH